MDTVGEDEKSKEAEGYYSFRVSPHLYERIEQHILILKNIEDRTTTKQRWISHAIKEKVESDAKNPLVQKESILNVKIDKNLDNQVLERIEYIKKFRSSYSKKQWLVDAIHEKLQKEEREAQKKMKDKQKSHTDAYKHIEQLQDELEALKAKLSKVKMSS